MVVIVHLVLLNSSSRSSSNTVLELVVPAVLNDAGVDGILL